MSYSLTHADDFNATDDTDIDGRTLPTGGSTWAKNSTGGGRTDIVSNQAKQGVDGGVIYYVSGVSVTEQKAEMTYISGGVCDIVLRYNAGSCYLADFNGGTTYYYNGGFNSLGSISGSNSANDVLALEIDSGGNMVARRNGTSVGTYSDSNVATGAYGFFENNVNSIADDWNGYQAAGGGTSTAVFYFHRTMQGMS